MARVGRELTSNLCSLPTVTWTPQKTRRHTIERWAALPIKQKRRSNNMNKFFLLVLVLGLVTMAGCSKTEESAEEPGEKKGAVSEEPIQPAPEGETEARAEPRSLAGETGSSSRWGSGWLDLATVADFAAGDVLRLRIGGKANKVLVRLLPEGKFPDSSAGIVGGAITVPENRVVEVVLGEDRKGIIQISVHGGPNPWGRFPLGGGNGSATLEAAILVR